MKLSRLFLPDTPDVLGMLVQQAEVTVEGMDALVRWADGDPDASDAVRDAEHRADEFKRVLRLALRTSFLTPLDAEDLYALSERLDAALNQAKDAVREAEVDGPRPRRPRARDGRGTWPRAPPTSSLPSGASPAPSPALGRPRCRARPPTAPTPR